MIYKVYAFMEGKWYFVSAHETNDEAKESADDYYKLHGHNTVIEVEDGGKH